MPTPTTEDRPQLIRRPVLHLVTDDEAYVLDSLSGACGRLQQLAARIVVEAALTEGWLGDRARVAATLRNLLAEHAATEPA